MLFPSDYIWKVSCPPSYLSRTGLVYCDDSSTILRDLPSESVDMVLTDPPYGISYRSSGRGFRGPGSTGERGVEVSIRNDTPVRASHLFSVLVHEAERVLKPGGCICCFAPGGGPNTTFAHWAQLMSRVLEFKQAAIWNKNRIGLGGHYRHCYEFILVAKKRGAVCKWRGGYGTGNVFTYSRPKWFPGQHPTPKPVDLMSHLISLHSDPGDVILDPFFGHGSSLVAAETTGRRFLGVELNQEYVEYATQKLEREKDETCPSGENVVVERRRVRKP